MIKKLFTLLLILLIPSMIQAEEIGFIDISVIFQKAKQVQKFQDNFKEREEEFKEQFEKKTKPIEEAIAKGKEQSEIEQMILERDEELSPKRQELGELELSFEKNLLLDIETYSKKIAIEYGITVVVDKRMLYYGGMDLTDLVLEKLNN